jgi:hydrogenase expression/formation protein HypC
MCLGVPGKVLAVDGLEATVDFFGVRKVLRLDIVDEPVTVGDYVLNHVGFAIRRIPPSEVEETLALFEQVLRDAGADDLMAADVRGEMAAAPAARTSEQAAPHAAAPQRAGHGAASEGGACAVQPSPSSNTKEKA